MFLSAGAAAIAADVAVDEHVYVELLLLLCDPASPMTISTAHDGKDNYPLGYRSASSSLRPTDPPAGGRRGRSQRLPSQ